MSDRLLKESDVLRIAFQLPLVVNSAFVNAVKAIPSADRPQEWIPCSERLPEEGQTVLIHFDRAYKYEWEEERHIEFGRISSDRYDADGCGWEWLNESGADFWAPIWNNTVAAWMPLPEPWKGADDEQ